MSVHAVIVAAGSSTRTGGDQPKQFADLGGRPVLAWSIAAFADVGVDSIVVVGAAQHLEATARTAQSIAPTALVVEGGSTRAESVRSGLARLTAEEHDIVLIHDAARPLVSERLIKDVVGAAARTGAATPALPATDTLVHASGTMVEAIVDRSSIRRVQTPQGFHHAVIARAHRMAQEAGDEDPTDDAGLVRRHLGLAVSLVPGDEANLKITTAADFVVVRALLAARLDSEQA